MLWKKKTLVSKSALTKYNNILYEAPSLSYCISNCPTVPGRMHEDAFSPNVQRQQSSHDPWGSPPHGPLDHQGADDLITKGQPSLGVCVYLCVCVCVCVGVCVCVLLNVSVSVCVCACFYCC